MTSAVAAPSVNWSVPDTADDVCSVAVRFVVAPLVIDGLPNAAANGLARDKVALSTSVATKLIVVPVMTKPETTGASLVPVMVMVTGWVLVAVPSLTVTL